MSTSFREPLDILSACSKTQGTAELLLAVPRLRRKTQLHKMRLKRKCRHLCRIGQYSAESSIKLQSCTVFYSCWPNTMAINTSEQDISSNFVCFVNVQYRFHSCRKFQTSVQNFDFGFFQFESETEMAKFQYRRYLVTDRK